MVEDKKMVEKIILQKVQALGNLDLNSKYRIVSEQISREYNIPEEIATLAVVGAVARYRARYSDYLKDSLGQIANLI